MHGHMNDLLILRIVTVRARKIRFLSYKQSGRSHCGGKQFATDGRKVNYRPDIDAIEEREAEIFGSSALCVKHTLRRQHQPKLSPWAKHVSGQPDESLRQLFVRVGQ